MSTLDQRARTAAIEKANELACDGGAPVPDYVEGTRPMRTGDHVHHAPSGETWVVAWADHKTGYMAPCGWPECQAKISDCTITKRATDDECADLIKQLRESSRRDADNAARIAALSIAPSTADGWRPTHRHMKRGTEYVLLGIGKMQTAAWREPMANTTTGSVAVDLHPVAIYRSVDDGSLWARPREEFEDGRFEPLPAATGGR